jgi:hypothetical protein
MRQSAHLLEEGAVLAEHPLYRCQPLVRHLKKASLFEKALEAARGRRNIRPVARSTRGRRTGAKVISRHLVEPLNASLAQQPVDVERSSQKLANALKAVTPLDKPDRELV